MASPIRKGRTVEYVMARRRGGTICSVVRVRPPGARNASRVFVINPEIAFFRTDIVDYQKPYSFPCGISFPENQTPPLPSPAEWGGCPRIHLPRVWRTRPRGASPPLLAGTDGLPRRPLSGPRVTQGHHRAAHGHRLRRDGCSQALPCPEAEGLAGHDRASWNNHPRHSRLHVARYFLKD